MRNLITLAILTLPCINCLGGMKPPVDLNRFSEESIQTCTVSLPEAWKAYLAVSDLVVIGKPFYSPSKAFGICPQVRIGWFLTNLTNEPLYLKVIYGSPNPQGKGQTGFGVGYALHAHEQRAIHSMVPAWSAVRSTKLQLDLIELRLPGQRLRPSKRHRGTTTEPLQISESIAANSCIAHQTNGRLRVDRIYLASTDSGERVLDIHIVSTTGTDYQLAIQTSVGDPSKIDWGKLGVNPLSKSKGSFVEKRIKLSGQDRSLLRTPYIIPSDAGTKPLLAYNLSVPQESIEDCSHALGGFDVSDRLSLSHGGRLVATGCMPLKQLAEEGGVTLPVSVPIETRAQLTTQRRSNHFLFRYRPESFAAEHINQIVHEREVAYEKLKAMLLMDLPITVTIDLYPDMEAKGLGSGTKWTPANTLNNRHIAEVYNQGYQCDACHELAHIFTFHFGGGGQGLCEPFAVYCEADNDVSSAMECARQKLAGDSLRPFYETLSSPSDELSAFIHYLLSRNLDQFKEFYVATSRGKSRDELDKTCRDIYGMNLEDLDQQWRSHLRAPSPNGNVTGKGR